MVAKKSTAADTATETVKAAPKKRTPKPVTDLATANAAFQAAKRKAERATKAADAARKAEADANAALADAAGVLKGYLGEVDAAVGNVLPADSDGETDPVNEYDNSDDAPYNDEPYTG